MHTKFILALILGFGMVGCQSTGIKQQTARKQLREPKTDHRKTTNRSGQTRRSSHRGKLNQFSLYDRGDIDYKLLRRGQRHRFRR